ncbi:Smr/MutS family protein [uncultured Roseovarius sp.]|uniref:Smr/MutS family protein n=1 Tax=uncultured Roseovarius sp. TaxID=293344 RepID=UPI000C64EB49|nr:DNA mismatch repair protein MutS [Roseovarius sp.]MBD11261.1 DNA mismatch repair protein MutS [Roseovarius sp.]
MSRRRVRPEELELWQQVARTAQRIRPEAATRAPAPAPHPEPMIRNPRSAPPTPRIEDFQIGQKAAGAPPAHDVLPGLSERVATAPVQMDKKAFHRMKRGKLIPEAKIDLHGMTMDRAHPALTGFILRSHAAGLRLVLVVTGKGKDRDTGGPIPVRHGVLRHNVPQWLRMPPLASLVLQITEAHLKHGGGGAYYVYLRRQR